MKNTQLSTIKMCALVMAITGFLPLSAIARTQTLGDQKAAPAVEWKTVEDIFGFPGADLPGGVVRYNMPRKDLRVTIGDVQVKPGLALGAWAAFHHVGENDVMVMGDLVLAGLDTVHEQEFTLPSFLIQTA